MTEREVREARYRANRAAWKAARWEQKRIDALARWHEKFGEHHAAEQKA